jgi:hypothetical protein
MNIERARQWLDLLKQASISQPNVECQLMNVNTSCNTPGCVAGWTYQLMKKHHVFNTIKEEEYEYDTIARKLMKHFELGKEEDVDYYETFEFLTEQWTKCFNLKYAGYPFSCASSYTLQREPELNDIPLSLVVQRWEEFINFMEKRNETISRKEK